MPASTTACANFVPDHALTGPNARLNASSKPLSQIRPMPELTAPEPRAPQSSEIGPACTIDPRTGSLNAKSPTSVLNTSNKNFWGCTLRAHHFCREWIYRITGNGYSERQVSVHGESGMTRATREFQEIASTISSRTFSVHLYLDEHSTTEQLRRICVVSEFSLTIIGAAGLLQTFN